MTSLKKPWTETRVWEKEAKASGKKWCWSRAHTGSHGVEAARHLCCWLHNAFWQKLHQKGAKKHAPGYARITFFIKNTIKSSKREKL